VILLYRGDDGYTDDSASDNDSMPGLVNESDDEDLEDDPDEVPRHTTTNDITEDTFDEEEMCKFMEELRVAETEMTEPAYIEECPLCGLFKYPDDPRHTAICHLHVYCHACDRFEGTYFGVDRCDGLPTMDEDLLQPVTNDSNHEEANVVIIPYATYRHFMTYPIGLDEISDDHMDNPQEPIIIDTGSKLAVFKEYLAFTHYHQCSEPIPLQYELQSGQRSTIDIHGVGHVGPLKRCLHAPGIPVSIFSPVHYTHWYPDSAFLYTASMAYVLDVDNPSQYGEDALGLLQASTVITTFQESRGIYRREDYEFIYWRPHSEVPDFMLHPDISEAKTSDDEAIIYMMMSDVLDADGTIDVHELLSAITELSDDIPPPGAVDTYDPLDHMVLTADGSIEITLKQGDSSILITPDHDLYAVLRAIIDSGASISIFNQRHWFRDFEEVKQPIRTAGKTIMSLGRGTVGKLHGCLYVPALQKNLISVSHVCKDLGGYFIMDDAKCQFIDKRSQKVVFSCSITSDLYSTMDLTWLGIYSATLAPPSVITRERGEAIANYIDGIYADAMVVQQCLMETTQRR
jgi:hypothetical protein